MTEVWIERNEYNDNQMCTFCPMRNHSTLRCAPPGSRISLTYEDSDTYFDRQSSYGTANAPLSPHFIVQTRTSEDVSRVVKVLANAEGRCAVCSGGHTQWAGSNDIFNGVTIDLGRMMDRTYHADTKLALIQPGSRLSDVSEKLLQHSVCVTGGQDGNVGVGGLLTGGGNSYYAGLYGSACDNVAEWEVVLAKGNILNDNAISHTDFWTALKEGSGNFGIVTRFYMYTFPAHDLWGGNRASTGKHGIISLKPWSTLPTITMIILKLRTSSTKSTDPIL
jgi:FAD/FMN-containing dehydrogenase